MQSPRLILSLVVLLLFPTSARNQAAKSPDSASRNSDEQQVLNLEKQWVDAEMKHDATRLRRILDDKFLVTFGIEKPYDKDAFIKGICSGDVDPTETQVLTDETVFIDNDTAVVVGTDTLHGTRKGAAYTEVARYTTTYIRRHGEWVALAEHLVEVPPAAAATNKDEIEIRVLLDRWAKAFEARDVDLIMSNYASGDAVVAYDIAPPLQYKGKEAYQKDYQEFLAQYDGPIHVEYREMRVLSDGAVGFVHTLEHFTGKLKSGQPSDIWLRYTGGLHKINGRWLIVHDHVSVPTDFESGKALLDLKP